MARMDRAMLDGATYPVVTQVPTRYDDLDTLGHVNNVATAVIFEEARVLFNRHAGMGTMLAGRRPMVVGLHIEFAAEIHYPDAVEVWSGTLAIGRTSFTIAQVARQNGRGVAYAHATIVVTDADGAAPLPAAMRESYERLRLVAA